MNAPKFECIDINDITIDPKNARIRGEQAKASLRASITRFGAGRSIVLDADNTIHAGNGTVEAARAEGVRSVLVVEPAPGQLVAVRRPDWSEHQARAYAIADNQLPQLDTSWDEVRLAQILESLPQPDRAATGFDEASIASLLASVRSRASHSGGGPLPTPGGQGGATTATAAPGRETADQLQARLQAKWQVSAGQLWEIPSQTAGGRSHRVLCGDCRDPAALASLLGGGRVNGCVTSPPYANQRAGTYGGVVAHQYVEWFGAVQANIRECLAPDGSFFLNIDTFAEDGENNLYIYDLVITMKRDWGWKFIDELCWQRSGPPGKFSNRFKSGWEPVFHFAPTVKIKFNPWNVAHASEQCFVEWSGRREMSTRSGFGVKDDSATGLALPSNVIRVHTAQVAGHSAAFPLDLPAFLVRAYSDPGDTWLDPFLGSGTTLLACEQHGRLARGIEQSPGHVALILERCSEAGLTPALAR